MYLEGCNYWIKPLPASSPTNQRGWVHRVGYLEAPIPECLEMNLRSKEVSICRSKGGDIARSEIRKAFSKNSREQYISMCVLFTVPVSLLLYSSMY
jgi:hypothetical protein